ncbi:MAG: DUF4249 domain-containing protein [Cytophagaceae bacterium]|nr:DUF4249 domain-containing protein [Cytophagaceae bacterium]
MKKHLYKFGILASVIIFSSCEKVIDVDLKSVASEIVIEANVSDQPGPYLVSLTKTVNFDQPNAFPAVTGAVVIVNDNLGNADTLTEISPGKYNTSTLAGVPGRNYFLKVQAEGKEYTAASFMPSAVTIDTILVDSLTFGSVSNKFLNVKFTDPPGLGNFYRVIEIINGDTLSTINIGSDEFEDGQQITAPIFSDEDPKLESGDNVVILLQCIDENVYNYFLELLMMINSNGQSAAPANPTSNINNHALGYFNAYSVRSKSIVIP